MVSRMVELGGGMPAHRQIAQTLRNRIALGQFASGQLPTELDLMNEFGVSRNTVRAALGRLVNDGLVERYPGRGTFVVPRRQVDRWSIRSLDDIVFQQFPERPRLLCVNWITSTDDAEAAEELLLDHDARMLRITALRGADGRPLACSEIFLPEGIGRTIEPGLEEHMGREPLVRMIEARCGLTASRVVQKAQATAVDTRVTGALGVKRGSFILQLNSTYFTAENQPFEFVRLFGKPDIFRYQVEFSRRQG